MLVWHADHSDIGNCVVAVEDVLDFGGIDVFTASDDHVSLAVVDVQEAAFVDVPHITGVEPAILYDLESFLFTAPVTIHDLGRTADDFADVTCGKRLTKHIDDSNFHTSCGLPARQGQVLIALQNLMMIFGR
ncbi:hypothetical protein D3C84_923550 [compost metagenome]